MPITGEGISELKNTLIQIIIVYLIVDFATDVAEFETHVSWDMLVKPVSIVLIAGALPLLRNTRSEDHPRAEVGSARASGAAQPREEVAVPQPAAKQGRQPDEQFIPRRVAQAVVDPFEVIKIQKQQRSVHAIASRFGKVPPHLRLETVSGEEASERILVREACELRLEALTL